MVSLNGDYIVVGVVDGLEHDPKIIHPVTKLKLV